MGKYTEDEFSDCVETAYHTGFKSALKHVLDMLDIFQPSNVERIKPWLQDLIKNEHGARARGARREAKEGASWQRVVFPRSRRIACAARASSRWASASRSSRARYRHGGGLRTAPRSRVTHPCRRQSAATDAHSATSSRRTAD